MAALTPDLSQKDKSRLIKGAIEGKKYAYDRYSNFPVGAALLFPPLSGSEEGDNIVVKGCSVENASYGGTICAERTAVVKAISEGHRRIIGVAVVSDIRGPTSPCGMCRQVLREFCALDAPILLVPAHYDLSDTESDPADVKRGDAAVIEVTLGELLPRSFGPEDLDLPRVPH